MADHEARIAELLALKANWNSYRAPSIKPEAIERARPFLELLDDLGADPWLTPMTDGGIAIERAGPDDYMIEFNGDGSIAVYFDGLTPEIATALIRCALTPGDPS